MPDNENPYRPPATVVHHVDALRRSFQVGDEEVYIVVVETSLWGGLRTYLTDAAGNSTFVQRGPCQFVASESLLTC